MANSSLLLEARVRWNVLRRHDAKSAWTVCVTEGSEHNGRAGIEQFRRDYPQYEWELRKVTTIEERVDA